MAFRQLAEEMLSWASVEAQPGSDAPPSEVAASAQDPAHAPAEATSIPTPHANACAAEMVY